MAEDFGVSKEFLENALGFSVAKFEVKPGSEVGDNYACVLLSVAVWKEGAADVLNVVIKCFPNHPARQAFLESSNIFVQELGTYKEIIPELYKFQEELKLAKIVEPPFPEFINGNCITAETKKNLDRPLQLQDNYIMMPDLRTPENGSYRLRDRFLGFDLAHYRLVIEAQARLHALSWAYKTKAGIKCLVDRYPFATMSAAQAEGFKSMAPLVQGMCASSKKTYEDDPRIGQAIDALALRYNSIMGLYFGIDLGQSETNYTKDTVLVKPVPINENEEPWLVLLHGDAWSNNMMFRYDEKTGQPVQVLFVDLQLTREGDPLSDIVYALYCSTGRELRSKHLSSMLHVYYDTFTQVCKRLSVPTLPGFTWEEFNRRFRRAKILGASCAMVGLPIMLKNPHELVDMDTIKTEDNKDEGLSELFTAMITSKSSNPILDKRLKDALQDMVDDDVL